MAIYNTSFMDNSTNILQIATGFGNAIGKPFLFGNLMLFSFFIIFLILTYRHNFLEVLLIDSFLTTVVAALLYVSGLITAVVIIYPFVLFMIVLIFYLFS